MGFGISNKLRKHLFKYNPEEYWKKRGKVYQDQFVETQEMKEQEKALLRCLEKLSFQSVLEFGCGFGRMTKIILSNYPIKRYLAFDLSSDQVINAKKNCIAFDNVEFCVSQIQDFSTDEKFDLVFGAEVLLHIPPKNIFEITQKLTGFAKKNFVNIDWFPEKIPGKIAEHNFIHPYIEIFNKVDKINHTDITRINKLQCIFNSTIK